MDSIRINDLRTRMTGLNIKDSDRTRDRTHSTISIKNGMLTELKVDPIEADINLNSYTINGVVLPPFDFFLGVEQIIKARRDAAHAEPHDPRIINLTPYTLVINSKGENTTIPFSGKYLRFDRKDERMQKLCHGEGPELNTWPSILANTQKTLIVTEDVGLWLSRPENAHEWKGQIVGPVGLASDSLGHRETPKIIEVNEDWVVYKEVTPPLRKVSFDPNTNNFPFL